MAERAPRCINHACKSASINHWDLCNMGLSKATVLMWVLHAPNQILCHSSQWVLFYAGQSLGLNLQVAQSNSPWVNEKCTIVRMLILLVFKNNNNKKDEIAESLSPDCLILRSQITTKKNYLSFWCEVKMWKFPFFHFHNLGPAAQEVLTKYA